MKNINLILTILTFNLSFQSKADSWIDPSWRYMLDSSDLIAQIEYKEDVIFLQNLLDAKLVTESYDINSFTKAINEINKINKTLDEENK